MHFYQWIWAWYSCLKIKIERLGTIIIESKALIIPVLFNSTICISKHLSLPVLWCRLRRRRLIYQFIGLLTYLFTFFCLFNTSKAKMLTRVQTLQKSRQVNIKYYKENVTICTKIHNLQLIDWLTNWLADWLNDCVTDYLLISLC